MQKYQQLKQILQSRRSIFPHLFNNEAISEKELEIIFDVARFAPSHKLTQPWRFTAYQKTAFSTLISSLETAMNNQQMLEVSQKLSKISDKLNYSQAAVLIGVNLNPDGLLPYWEEIAATAMAVQNIWLLAGQMNIGTYWSSPAFLIDSGIDLGHSGDVQCLGIMYFGKVDPEVNLTVQKRNILSDYFTLIK